MALLTSILTGGSNNHPTTSEEAGAWATDFISEGIVGSITSTGGTAPSTGGFAVNAQGTPDMTVAVSTGVAYVTGTPTSQNSQTFRVKNTASANVTISANSSGSTKYDWIYISLSAANLANPNVAGDNAASLATSRSTSAVSDDGTPPTYGYPIAVVTVINGATSITNGGITDPRESVVLNEEATGESMGTDGWSDVSDVWTYASATTINVPSDATTVYTVGDFVEFAQSTTKRFIVMAATSTLLTVLGIGSDTVANSTISAIRHAKVRTPFGVPYGVRNPYSFRARRSSALNMTSSFADIIFNTETYDYNNNYDTTTGLYTVPITGVYRFVASMNVSAVSTARALIQIVCSTTGTQTGCDYEVTRCRRVQNAWSVRLVAGETVKCQGLSVTTNDVNSTETWFAGELIHAE